MQPRSVGKNKGILTESKTNKQTNKKIEKKKSEVEAEVVRKPKRPENVRDLNRFSFGHVAQFTKIQENRKTVF